MMNKLGLFVCHRAKPGMRDAIRRVWEKHVKPRAAANPGHEAYYFCQDNQDPDTVRVFQLFASEAAMKDFLAGEWYPGYLKEVGEFVASPPEIAPADLVWAKPSTTRPEPGDM